MTRKLFVLIFATVLMAGCSKSSDSNCSYTEINVTVPPSEIATLEAWINTNRPAAIKHSSGFFYEIVTPGAGATANVCSRITVKYVGKLLNGTTFEDTTTGSGVSFSLGGVIPGWQKSIPLIKPGGSINIYLPPSLAYGSQPVKDNNGNVVIPGDSYLIFSIQLLNVQ
jgi:FKBP-type peptidyl-prolyl cis-trans isomerase